MGRINHVLSTASSYIVARVTTAIVKDGPHSIDLAAGRKKLKVIAKNGWYKEFKAQYENSWDFHPIVLELFSYVDLQELETEAGREKFLHNLKAQLEVLHWK